MEESWTNSNEDLLLKRAQWEWKTITTASRILRVALLP